MTAADLNTVISIHKRNRSFGLDARFKDVRCHGGSSAKAHEGKHDVQNAYDNKRGTDYDDSLIIRSGTRITKIRGRKDKSKSGRTDYEK